jgi:hypothetical protein
MERRVDPGFLLEGGANLAHTSTVDQRLAVGQLMATQPAQLPAASSEDAAISSRGVVSPSPDYASHPLVLG